MPKELLPNGIIVKVHPKGWMDEELTNFWLKEVWCKRPGALLHKKSLLVWDMFRAHLTDSVKKNLRRHKTNQVVIPGGTTSILQPLDVSLNKPFKSNIRKLWNTWMLDGKKEYTPAGNMKRPSIALVCGWVVSAWNDIPSDMVAKSFRKCGISNAVDGTEDELFADYLLNGNTESTITDDATDDLSEKDNDIYDDTESPMTTDEFEKLFGGSDEEFDGFTQDDIDRIV